MKNLLETIREAALVVAFLMALPVICFMAAILEATNIEEEWQ